MKPYYEQDGRPLETSKTRERTDADALARPVRPGMQRYRIHNTDGTTTTIEARSIWQAREVAVMLDQPFNRIEGL